MDHTDLLKRFVDRTLIYVGKASVERIDAFLCGYAICLYDHHIADDDGNEYDKLLERKYTGGERERWSIILYQNSNN